MGALKEGGRSIMNMNELKSAMDLRRRWRGAYILRLSCGCSFV